VNHYSDAVFRLGLFVPFVLAAGLGAESLLGRPRARRRILFVLFAVNGAASIAWLVLLQRRAAPDNYLFGVAVALLVLYGVALARFARARTSAGTRRAFLVLLVLLLADTSTLAFAHLRVSLAQLAGPIANWGAETIGSVDGGTLA